MRIVTLNIWQEQGPWSKRLAYIESNLRALDPDVVCLQEVRQVPGRVPNQASTLASALGMACTYEIAQSWGGGDEGLAVLSRSPAVESRICELPRIEGRSRRICLGVCVRAAEDRVWIFTTHLAYRLTDGQLRANQVRAVDSFVEQTRSGTAVLCGDFNAVPDSDEIRYLKGLTSIEDTRTYYQDAYSCCHPLDHGWSWASENPYTAEMAWLPADRRLDYIFVTPRTRTGAGRVLECRLVCQDAADDGTLCSDHYGVLAEIAVGDS